MSKRYARPSAVVAMSHARWIGVRDRRSNCRSIRQFLRTRSRRGSERHARGRAHGGRHGLCKTASALRIDRHRNAGRTRRSAPLLRSFWLTAFEGAEHLAVVRTTRDAIDVTAYAWRVDADYAAAACEAGIACVRETIDPLLAGANRRHSP